MLDIKLIRKDPKLVRENLERRSDPEKLKLFDELLKADEEYRALIAETNKLRSERNKLSKEIATLKKQGKDIKEKLKEAEEIAKAGQARTLRDHTYIKRMEQTAEILERHLRYKREKNLYQPPDMSEISYGHKSIDKSEVNEALTTAWQSEEIPVKQRALVRQELENMYKGKPPIVYKVLTDCLRPHVFPECSILEIGCASGYYYEILEYLLNMRISYTGVDYSESLITMAKDYYPKADFFVADGANLPFSDRQFYISISSCILLHVTNYQDHIRETVRAAEKYVVAHRTPVCRQRPTQYLKKFAYGVETVELRFNEDEILEEFSKNALSLINAIEYYSNSVADEFEVTYIFRKK